MRNDINVVVVRYGDRKYLMMRYTDPITNRQIARSTGTTNGKQAERTAAKWEAALREGRYAPQSNITWEAFRDRVDERFRELMQHASIETTLKYFVGFNAEKTADILWNAHESRKVNNVAGG